MDKLPLRNFTECPLAASEECQVLRPSPVATAALGGYCRRDVIALDTDSTDRTCPAALIAEADDFAEPEVTDDTRFGGFDHIEYEKVYWRKK
jgi:hypothetical protein